MGCSRKRQRKGRYQTARVVAERLPGGADRLHASLKGVTPIYPTDRNVIALDDYQCEAHCRGLYQLSAAAWRSIRHRQVLASDEALQTEVPGDGQLASEEVLQSMALITDEPPVEVARAGHDRCPINLTREAALAWLQPEGRSAAELFEILSQRQRPTYQHRLAVAA